MAKFKDPVLKQIVDDLAIQNPTAPVIPVEMASLSDAVADATGLGDTNTRGTLTLTGDVNIPAGTMTVHYRRLELATLIGDPPPPVTFIGVESQSKTLEEILTALLPAALVPYILPELVDEGPYTLTRSSLPVAITPKATSQVLTPAGLTVGTMTVPADLSTFTTLNNIYPWAVFPTATDDPKEFVTKRILLANGYSEPLAASDFNLEVIQTPFDQGYGTHRTVKITVTAPGIYYTGEQTFRYSLADLGQNADGVNNPPTFTYTAGQTAADVIGAALAAKNKYFDPSDLVDMPLRPVRLGDYTSNDQSAVLCSDTSLVYAPGYTPMWIKATASHLYPYEEIIRFNVDVAGVKQILQTTNTGTMPVTIELLEKPAAFAPATLDVNASFNTTQSLPVGVYKIRITRPDSYRTKLTHRTSASSTTQIRVTEVFKAKGHSLQELYRYCTDLTVVHPGAFDEATDTYVASYLFGGCTGLTSLPAGVFDAMINCVNWSNALESTTGLKVYPAALFGFIKTFQPTLTNMFANAGPDDVTADLFQNIRYTQLSGLFNGATNIKTVAPGFIAAMDLKRETTSFSSMFFNCSSLQAIPEDLFVGVRNAVFLSDDPYFGYWSLASCFARCSSLTSIPAGLFEPLKERNLGNVLLTTTFEKCTGLTTLPSGLFDGLRFPTSPGLQGTFFDCTALATIPGDLFHNAVLGNAFGDKDSVFSNGAFMNTGLTAIPADFFANNEANVKGAKNLFWNTKITQVPAGLLDGCVAMETIAGMFQSCALLTTVPADAFSGAPNVLLMEGLFRECTSLASIPAGLFDAQTQATGVQYIFWNAALTSYPPALFANNTALVSAEGAFLNCPITGVPDNVFENHPALTTISHLFEGTDISGVGSGAFAGAPEITTVRSLFSDCELLASVPGDLFANQTKITNASGLFQHTEVLATVPAELFATNPLITDVSSLFAWAAGLTSIPAALLDGLTGITTIGSIARNCTALTAIPAGLFSDQTVIERFDQAFEGCTQITAIPNGLFASTTTAAKYFDSVFKGCTALTSIGTGLFGASNTAVSLMSIFEGCTALQVVPDQIFFAFTNITSLRFAFLNCYALTDVGRLVYNTTSVKIEIAGFLGGDLVNTGPAVYPNFTVADNVIDGSVVFNVGPYGFAEPFNRRGNWTKNIDNLFGANVRIPFEGNSAARGWMSDMPITGSGQAFITKHTVPTTQTGFFKNSTSLSDYATLPAWAKT